MKQGQRVFSLELFNSILGKVYDTLYLRVLRHLHEPQGYFCHRGEWDSENWIRDIVEIVIEVAWGKASSFDSLNPVLPITLISCPASCVSSFIFILWIVLGQIIC